LKLLGCNLSYEKDGKNGRNKQKVKGSGQFRLRQGFGGRGVKYGQL